MKYIKYLPVHLSVTYLYSSIYHMTLSAMYYPIT